jgi:hypothetical protein
MSSKAVENLRNEWPEAVLGIVAIGVGVFLLVSGLL